jgi:predicted dithiol-disulfide oxidoreductase (DUF899 family)
MLIKGAAMTAHPVVSQDQWLAARRVLLDKEKAFTRQRDALAAERRALPWVKVEQDYAFTGPDGELRLSDLFAGHSQLIVYHFMFHPDWEAGCKSCSFWADGFNPIVVHLNQRDVAFAAVSRAPYAQLAAFKRRMSWSFPWVSSEGTTFNRDFAVSFTPEELAREDNNYNFGTRRFGGPEAPGLSVFARDGGAIYRTYACYARGLDAFNSAYQYLDLVPKGRDEDALPYPMAWVRLRDAYGK